MVSTLANSGGLKVTYRIRVIVAHLDRAARETVVELTQQRGLPHIVNLLLGVPVTAILQAGDGSQPLDIPQQELGLPVVPLVVGLRRVRAAVQLEVQLAIPRHERVGLALQLVEEVVDRAAHVHARQEADLVADASAPAQLLDVLPCRTAAAVTLAEDDERGRVLIQRLVLRHAALDVAEVGLRRVRLRRWHVTDDLAAVEGDPVESGVRELVDVVPAQLLSEEVVHPRQTAQLR